MFIRTLTLTALLAAFLAGPVWSKGSNPSTRSQKASYSLGGSTTVDKLMQLAIERYTKLKPDVQIAYEGVGSSNGVKNVLNDTYILGGSSRELKSSEIDAGAKGLAIAYDAIVVVVNNTIPLKDMDLDTVKRIFSGEVRSWQEVDPALSGDITVISREAGSGTHASFKDIVLGKKADFRDDALITVSNGDVAAKVSSTENSIGYIGVGYMEQVQGRAHALTINGVAAEQQSISGGAYPIARSLYLVYQGQLDGFKKEFSDFLLSPEGQQAVAEAEFFPVS